MCPVLRKKRTPLFALLGHGALSPPAKPTSGRLQTLSRGLHRKALVPPASGGSVGFVESLKRKYLPGQSGKTSC